MTDKKRQRLSCLLLVLVVVESKSFLNSTFYAFSISYDYYTIDNTFCAMGISINTVYCCYMHVVYILINIDDGLDIERSGIFRCNPATRGTQYFVYSHPASHPFYIQSTIVMIGSAGIPYTGLRFPVYTGRPIGYVYAIPTEPTI